MDPRDMRLKRNGTNETRKKCRTSKSHRRIRKKCRLDKPVRIARNADNDPGRDAYPSSVFAGYEKDYPDNLSQEAK
jgi:hypothetical protein